MTPTEVARKLSTFESSLAEERGSFALFALAIREEVPDRWDLLISAPWLGDDEQAALAYLIAQIKSKLGAEYLTYLSRIVVVDPDHAKLQEFNDLVQVEHGSVDMRDDYLFGLLVKRAYIITSKRPVVPAAK